MTLNNCCCCCLNSPPAFGCTWRILQIMTTTTMMFLVLFFLRFDNHLNDVKIVIGKSFSKFFKFAIVVSDVVCSCSCVSVENFREGYEYEHEIVNVFYSISHLYCFFKIKEIMANTCLLRKNVDCNIFLC